MLHRILDHLAAAGVARVVVNTHWQREAVLSALAERRDLEIVESHEETLLDTGGAVVKALPLLGEAPFYVVNGDAFWLDGARPALLRLADAFDPDRLDAVLLVHRAALLPVYSRARRLRGRSRGVGCGGRARRRSCPTSMPGCSSPRRRCSPPPPRAPSPPTCCGTGRSRQIACARWCMTGSGCTSPRLRTSQDAEEALAGRVSAFAYAR
ncbi:MAG: NTP transferase domain-containing protein [Acetobacteraceae bacterium]|nr:NTP transferase domain-containing protein [Acetobacteraceae bacterium]